MALAFNKYYKTIPSSYKITGNAPIDLRQVVENLSNLYGPIAASDHTWENEQGDYIVYNGMIVAVLDPLEIYMCIDEALPYVLASWKKVGGASAAIFAVNIGEYPGYTLYDNKKCVVEYIDDKYYRLNDTAAEREPVDESDVIKPEEGEHFYAEMDDLSHYDPEEWGILIENENHPDVTNYGAGTYIKVEDEDGNITYSKVRIDLAPLEEKIGEVSTRLSETSTRLNETSTRLNETSTRLHELNEYVDSSLEDLRSDVDSSLSDLKEYVDSSLDDLRADTNASLADLKEYVDSSLEDLRADTNASLADLSTYVDTQDTSLKNYVDAREEVIREYVNDKFDEIDSSIDGLNERIADVSDSLINLRDVVADLGDTLVDLSSNVVNTVTSDSRFIYATPDQHDVVLTMDIVDASDATTFPSTGFVTDGYLHEQMAWHEIEGTNA